MKAVLDTNVLVRHLVGEPPEQAAAATELLRTADALFLPDLVAAELVYVLESVYGRDRSFVASALRALLTVPSVVVAEEMVLFRAAELYEYDRLHFAEAYAVAAAEFLGFDTVASFDRALDRVRTVARVPSGCARRRGCVQNDVGG